MAPSHVLSVHVVLFVAGLSVSRAVWPSVTYDSSNIPVVNIRLVPPKRAHPLVDEEVVRLRKDREELEASLYSSLEQSWQTAVTRAEEELRNVIDDTMKAAKKGFLTAPQGKYGGALGPSNLTRGRAQALTFLQQTAEDDIGREGFSLKVNLFRPEEALGRTTREHIRAMEKKRNDYLRKLFRQAVSEFQSLTEIVKRELKASLLEALTACMASARRSGHLKAGLSFAALSLGSGGVPNAANVRVSAATEKWPMISELLQDTEFHHDELDQNVRSRIAELQMQLLSTENDIIKRLLEPYVKSMRQMVSA